MASTGPPSLIQKTQRKDKESSICSTDINDREHFDGLDLPVLTALKSEK